MEIEHAVCFICLSEWLRDGKGKERAALVWKVFGRRKSHSAAALDNEPGQLHQTEGSGWTWGIDCFTEKQTFWGSLSKSKLKRTMSPQKIDRLMKRAVKRIQGKVWTWMVSNSNPLQPSREAAPSAGEGWGMRTDERQLRRQVEHITGELGSSHSWFSISLKSVSFSLGRHTQLQQCWGQSRRSAVGFLGSNVSSSDCWGLFVSFCFKNCTS